jgi:hypothetical protein
MLNVGVSGGVNRFFHSSDNSDFYWVGPDMLKKGGLNDNEMTFTFGFVTEIIPSNTSRSSFQFRLSYNSYSFKSDLWDTNNFRIEGIPTEYADSGITKTFLYRNDFTLKSFSLDLLYKYLIFDNLSIVAGTKINYFTDKEVIATENFVIPIEAQYKRKDAKVYINNDRTILIYQSDEVEEISNFNQGLNIGLQYSFKLLGFDINPFIKYDLYLTEFMMDKGWRLTSYNLGVDFMFSI